ncbi:hypothetical protein QBZ16_001235 [Prototheca wickerhamii]|uniref:rRNA-processing protein FYV7 n=1 Tax=Prototheca wickerhamii TaxID=3111 RepID=A0AAD9MG17_PROWI|nr:hypothetical protein QBZ16_001235 [Prototheca wickerhamii]
MAPVNKRRAFLRRDSGAPRSALEKFAQVGKSTYDPRLRREKERALNAKTVNKYRKIQKRVQQEWEETGVVPQRIAEKAQAEKEAARQEIEAKRKAIEEHWAKVAADKRRRAEENRKMRKKNARGQPLMKHRIEKILSKIAVE